MVLSLFVFFFFCSAILILSFALQMHIKPFMYARHIFSTEHKIDHEMRNKNVHILRKEETKIRNMAKYEAGDPHLTDKR